jgi:hypothetical protein
MPQHEKGPSDLHFTHFPSVMTVMESVSKTRWKMRWAERQGESKKKITEDKWRVCKESGLKVGQKKTHHRR